MDISYQTDSERLSQVLSIKQQIVSYRSPQFSAISSVLTTPYYLYCLLPPSRLSLRLPADRFHIDLTHSPHKILLNLIAQKEEKAM